MEEEKIIDYASLAEGPKLGNDPHGIGKYCIEEPLKKTFLSNPYLGNKQETFAVLECLDNIIMGRALFFPSKMKAGNELFNSKGGSSLYVTEEGRKMIFGASLVLHPIMNSKNTVLLYAGMTEMAIAIYKKLKFQIFDVPHLFQIRKPMPFLQRLGVKGLLLNISNTFLTPFVKVWSRQYSWTKLPPDNNLEVKRMTKIPDWVEDIVLKDTHKYAELHNKAWFEWVINNNFFNKELDTQNLYGFFKNGVPVGFVLLTEREERIESRGIDRLVIGKVSEWGTSNEKLLSEYQIYKYSLNLFSQNVDMVSISTVDDRSRKGLRWQGFLPRGSYNIAFKAIGINFDDDVNNIENWRIRTSYSDTIFY